MRAHTHMFLYVLSVATAALCAEARISATAITFSRPVYADESVSDCFNYTADEVEVPLVDGTYTDRTGSISIRVYSVARQAVVIETTQGHGRLCVIVWSVDFSGLSELAGVFTLPTTRSRRMDSGQQHLLQCSVDFDITYELVSMYGSFSAAQNMVLHILSQAQIAFVAADGLVPIPVARDVRQLDIGVNARADTTLYNYRALVAPVETCARYLMASRTFSTSTIGIAFVEGACFPAFAVGAVFNLHNPARAVFTLAHELCHSFGSDHNEADTTSLMYPSLSGYTVLSIDGSTASSISAWIQSLGDEQQCLLSLDNATEISNNTVYVADASLATDPWIDIMYFGFIFYTPLLLFRLFDA